MSTKEICEVLAIVAAFASGPITEAVKTRFGRPREAVDEAHKTHDELRADLAAERAESAAERAESARLKVALEASNARCFQLERENLELLRQNVNLDTDLKAVLKGGLTKS